jgi:hypothetical protein
MISAGVQMVGDACLVIAPDNLSYVNLEKIGPNYEGPAKAAVGRIPRAAGPLPLWAGGIRFAFRFRPDLLDERRQCGDLLGLAA